MSIKHKTRVGFSSAIVVLAAGFAAHTALSSGQVAEPSAAVFRPLSTAGLPQGLLDAAQSQARVAGLDPSTIAEAGVSAAGSPYRATLVARDDGTAYVSFASADAITSFTPATDALADQPMVVLEGTVGTPTELEEVGISIVVDSSVSRVDVESADGTTTPVVLTPWPNTPYASASISATVSSDFPKIVRAYNAAGVLVKEHDVDLTPVHF